MTTTQDQENFDLIDQEPISIIIPLNLANTRLDSALAQIIPEFSRNKLTNWIKNGFVLVGGNIAKPKDKVFGGEQITIYAQPSEDTKAYLPEDIPLNIIYEDEHLLVINKPAGLTVHPGAGLYSGTLLNGLIFHYPILTNVPRAGIVHRLDKDTSGLMVVAKTLLAQTDLVAQLQSRKVSRIYRAIVEGHPHKNGIINKNIGRDPHNRIKMAALEIGGKEAITNYRVLEYFDDFSYIECMLETGRTHQIRVHLKAIGHPVIGDPVYNRKKTNYPAEIVNALSSINRQCLHAVKLSFIHPASKQLVEFKTTLAYDIQQFLKVLMNSKPKIEFIDEYLDDDSIKVLYVK